MRRLCRLIKIYWIRIVCDTNPLIYLLDGDKDIAAFLHGKQVYISVISELELFGKQQLPKSDAMLIEALVNVEPVSGC